jgi:hypothetical protein
MFRHKKKWKPEIRSGKIHLPPAKKKVVKTQIEFMASTLDESLEGERVYPLAHLFTWATSGSGTSRAVISC